MGHVGMEWLTYQIVLPETPSPRPPAPAWSRVRGLDSFPLDPGFSFSAL